MTREENGRHNVSNSLRHDVMRLWTVLVKGIRAMVIPDQAESVVKTLDGFVYKPVGHCIYCGATENLGKEHILPFGLSGSAILPKSSCRNCASITGRTEQDILRGSFWPAVRAFRDLKSRSKHENAPSTMPVSIFRNGEDEVVMLRLLCGRRSMGLASATMPSSGS